MKKLFLLLPAAMIMAANIVHAELTPQPAIPTSYPTYCPQIALTVDEEEVGVMQPAVAYESGNDIEVVIFGEKFAVEKKFTIHDFATKYNTDAYDDIYLADMWVESTDIQNVVVTRNFFANNNKWCVLLCLKKGDYSNLAQKYIVVDEDGNLMGNLPQVPRGSDPNIFFDGFYNGTPFLLISEYDNDSNETFQLYTFTGQAGIEPVKVASFAKAYPNPLPAGQIFHVDLAQAADEATYISVVDMNGRQVLRKKVAYGETSCQISGIRHGQYIYTVIYKNGESVSDKLIAE